MPDNDKDQGLDNEQTKSLPRNQRIAARSQNTLDRLYRSTYFTSPENKQQLQHIRTDITNSINAIISNSKDSIGEPNISKLYERILLSKNGDEAINREFESIFSDSEFMNNLTSTYLDNRWIKMYDDEIDQVLKYMTKLDEALETIVDNVLSADSFSKDFLNFESVIGISDENKAQFDRNIETLKTKYGLSKDIKKWFKEILKYGEVFIYNVPYTKAIQRLMDNKANMGSLKISRTNKNSPVIMESASGIETIASEDDINKLSKANIEFGDLNVELENGIISSIVSEEKSITDAYSKVAGTSLTEQFMYENTLMHEQAIYEYDSTIAGSGVELSKNTFDMEPKHTKLPTHHNFDHTIDDDLELPDDIDGNAERTSNHHIQSKRIKEINGCIVRKLDRERVRPIILENKVCLGYYYFDYDESDYLWDETYTTTGLVNSVNGIMSPGQKDADLWTRQEQLLRSIASNLADKIDASFINANQDLKKEIYYILKYNDDFLHGLEQHKTIRVSYIPPEDITHLYLDLDEKTGRGRSALELSLIPAKLWVAIYITNCLAVMTRGNDKRVYYVRQSVDTNISKTLLKTISEIKKSNFNIRQVENINSILNITGRFNDYIIPRGPDGQSPVEFEIMQGQQVEIKTELLSLLEESAINPTGVPLEIIVSRQSPDYAMQLTMSNSKFLRMIYDLQADTEYMFNPFLTKLYDVEFNSIERIVMQLPPPLFINVTNTNQLIVNTNDYCENVANIWLADEPDEGVKAKFLKDYKMYCLGSYVRKDVLEKLYNKAKQESIKDYISNPENMGEAEG